MEDKKELPARVEEVDLLRLANLHLKGQVTARAAQDAVAQLERIKSEYNAAFLVACEKYQMNPQTDGVDFDGPDAGVIKRGG